jgi:hypothetical protein
LGDAAGDALSFLEGGELGCLFPVVSDPDGS